MKFLTALLVSVIATYSYANSTSQLDQLVGEYVIKGKTSSANAVIKKILIPRDDLFGKDRYIYQLDLDGEHGGVSLYEEMEVSEDGTFLYVNTSSECDDPSCYYMTSLIATAELSSNGTPLLTIEFEGFLTEEGDEDGYEFSGEEVYIKAN